MGYAYSVFKEKNVANVSSDRVFKLIAANDVVLMSRKRTTFNAHMFQGDKQLHAVQDSGLWYLVYKTLDGRGAGNLPEPLKQRWTNFNQLIKFLVPYFESRGVRIEEILS